MKNFEKAFETLLIHEGGYSNHKTDTGGETMWGITKTVARENGYVGDMRDMSIITAKIIYRTRYWLDAFDVLPYCVAFNLFDAAVNSGVRQSVKWLQRALGVDDDGRIGPVTIEAANDANAMVLVMSFNAERLLFLTNLAVWPDFGKGWARRIAANLKEATKT